MATKKSYKIYCTKTLQGIVYGDSKFYNKLAFAVGKAKKIFKSKSEALTYQRNNIEELNKKYPNFLTISKFSEFRNEFNSTLELVNKAKRMKCNISTNICWTKDNTLSSVITNKKVNTNPNQLDKKMKKAFRGDNLQKNISDANISQEIEKPLNEKVKEEIKDEQSLINDKNENTKELVTKEAIKETSKNTLDNKNDAKEKEPLINDTKKNDEDKIINKDAQKPIYWEKEASSEDKKENKLINDSIDKADIVVYTDASLSATITDNGVCLAMFLVNDLTEDKKTARAIKIDTKQFKSAKNIHIDNIELVAIHSALEFLQSHDKTKEDILIITDSNGAIKILNDQEDNFGTGKYRDVAKSTYKLLNKFSNVNFKLIKSHDNNYGNFLCDGIKYVAMNKIINN